MALSLGPIPQKCNVSNHRIVHEMIREEIEIFKVQRNSEENDKVLNNWQGRVKDDIESLNPSQKLKSQFQNLRCCYNCSITCFTLYVTLSKLSCVPVVVMLFIICMFLQQPVTSVWPASVIMELRASLVEIPSFVSAEMDLRDGCANKVSQSDSDMSVIVSIAHYLSFFFQTC